MCTIFVQCLFIALKKSALKTSLHEICNKLNKDIGWYSHDWPLTVQSNPVNPEKFVPSIFRPDYKYLDKRLIRVFLKNLDFCLENEKGRKYEA